MYLVNLDDYWLTIGLVTIEFVHTHDVYKYTYYAYIYFSVSSCMSVI